MKKRYLVGIILSELHHQFFANTSKKLQEELLAMNVDVCIFTTTGLTGMPEGYLKGENTIFDLIHPEMFDGFIIYPESLHASEQLNHFLLKLRNDYNKPVVCLDRQAYGFQTVGFKQEEGIFMLVDHLVNTHHASRIEYVSCDIGNEGIQKEQEQYFLDALRTNRVFMTEHSIHFGDIGNEALVIKDMIEQDGGLPEAIICGGTETVSGLICALEENGYSVPKDVIVCAYNLGIDESADEMICTTIFRDPTVMATNAARTLMNEIVGAQTYPMISKEHENILVPKATCGCDFYMLGVYSGIRKQRILHREHQFDSPFNFMEEEIAGAEDIEKCLWSLDSYEKYLGKDCEAFYLCLNEDVLQSQEGNGHFSDRMLLALNHSSVRKVSKEDFFRTDDLLPALNEKSKYPRVFYFASVHFLDRLFGYVSICYGNKPCGITNHFGQWMRCLSTALECQRQKMAFRQYYTENAIRDSVTGLYNFKGYLSALTGQYKHLEGKKRLLRIISLDINRFSSINELFGRDEGDVALLTLTKILQNSVNTYDICARLSNDEFVIAGIYEKEPNSELLIHDINDRLKNLNQFSEKQYTIDIVSTSDCMEITDIRQIEEKTNEILAEKKSMKRGMLTVNSETAFEMNAEERDAVCELLDKNLFTYRFQPIVSAKTGSIYAYEALMRFGHEESMPPLTILRYAEALGRTYEVEKLTFHNVVEIMSRNSEVFTDRKMFINSIPKAILLDEDYKALVLEFPGMLAHAVVEFTEQSEASDKQLETVRKRAETNGFRIAIDDYGTGYSNISNLLNYVPDYVKIDRSLITGIELDSKKQYFVANIVEFARANGFLTLAEGVETKEEMNTVIRLGVDLIQGFYTAKPADTFLEEIDKTVHDEIVALNFQASESRQKKTYLVDKEQEIMLMPLVTTDHYTEIVVNRSELSIVSNPRVVANVLIRVPDNTNTTIYLKRVNLESYQRHPCIEIGNNCDVTLIIEGVAVLNRKGIRVPESSRLTIVGDGKLSISGDGDRAFAIGGDSTQTIGKIRINMEGEISIRLDGKECVGIGGGYSNQKVGIFIEHCKNLSEVISGEKALAIGICNSLAPISIRDTRLKMEVNADRATAIGSITAECDVALRNVQFKHVSSGDSQVVIGCLTSREVNATIDNMNLYTAIKAKTCIGLGCRDGLANIRINGSELNMNFEGAEIIGIGTKTKQGRGQFEKTNFTTDFSSADSMDFGYEPENMSFLFCSV